MVGSYKVWSEALFIHESRVSCLYVTSFLPLCCMCRTLAHNTIAIHYRATAVSYGICGYMYMKKYLTLFIYTYKGEGIEDLLMRFIFLQRHLI